MTVLTIARIYPSDEDFMAIKKYLLNNRYVKDVYRFDLADLATFSKVSVSICLMGNEDIRFEVTFKYCVFLEKKICLYLEDGKGFYKLLTGKSLSHLRKEISYRTASTR